MDNLTKYMYNQLDNIIKDNFNNIALSVDYLLRHIIEKPIKGEVTKGKLRVRGITALVYNRYGCIGIMQHGKIVSFVKVPNGYKIYKED